MRAPSGASLGSKPAAAEPQGSQPVKPIVARRAPELARQKRWAASGQPRLPLRAPLLEYRPCWLLPDGAGSLCQAMSCGSGNTLLTKQQPNRMAGQKREKFKFTMVRKQIHVHPDYALMHFATKSNRG